MAYITWNGAMPTAAALPAVATGTTIKTMLQVATPSDMQIQLLSWGYTLSALPGATGVIELLQTDVAATVTAHAASGIYSLDPNAPASRVTLGTAATGYTASAEGSITATRVFDSNQIPITAGLVSVNDPYQFVLDERPIVAVSKFLRIRATMPTSGVNMLCWVCYNQL